METHKTEVAKVRQEPHPNADSLSIVKVHNFTGSQIGDHKQFFTVFKVIQPETTIYYVEGNSLIGGNIREGIVVRPVNERMHPQVGRVVLKLVSNAYLEKY